MFTNLSIWLNDVLANDILALWRGFVPLVFAIIALGVVIARISYHRAIRKSPDEEVLANRVRLTILFGLGLTVLAAFRLGLSIWTGIILLLALAASCVLLFSSLAGSLALVIVTWISFGTVLVDRTATVRVDLSHIEDFALSHRIAVVGACDALLMGVLLLEILTVVFTSYAVKLLALKKAPAVLRDENQSANAGEMPQNHGDEKLQEVKSETRKKLIAFILVFMLVLIPISMNDLSGYLVNGSRTCSNAYIDAVNSYLNDTSMGRDNDWIAAYSAAADNLESFNYRPFDINTRRISQNNLIYLTEMSQASLLQIWAMSDISDAITANGSSEEVKQLGTLFNSSNDMMLAAAGNGLALASSMSSRVTHSFVVICVDAFRFYTSFLPLWLYSVVVLVAAIILYVFNRKRERLRSTELPEPHDEQKLPSGKEKLCLKTWLISFGKLPWSRGRALLNGVLALGLFLLFIIVAATGIQAEKTYADVVQDAFVSSGSQVMSDLFTQEGQSDLPDAIVAQLETLDEFVNWEEPDDALTHERLSFEANQLVRVLYEMQSVLANGGEISRAQTRDYLELEVFLLRESLNIIVQNAIDGVAGILP